MAQLTEHFEVVQGTSSPERTWHSHCPLEPEEMLDRLSEGCGEVARGRVILEEGDRAGIDIDVFRGERRIVHSTREIDFRLKVITHSGLRCDPEGCGIGKRFLANSMRIYNECNFFEIRIRAALIVGGYVWARYGFKPAAHSWKQLRSVLGIRFSQFAALIDQATKELVEALLTEDDPATIWLISDLAVTVQYEGRPTKLGYALLHDTEWEGTLHLRDDEAMARFNGYCLNVAG